ncbi:5'-3' exonuclease [Staphylococcus felis]|uniref:5'-3' exonuclease n=1 Tax=Staphylococcus felis TaxID=46127 RepID=UPI003967D737
MSNRILLVDGMAMLFRHFYASSIHQNFMRNSEGIPTNGTQGFVRHIFSALKQIKPSHVAVCWDMGTFTFRNETFASYKSNRPEPPEELKPQFTQVKHISEVLQFCNIGINHFEADDVIGTLANHFAQYQNHEIYIITGDRDLLQCVDHNVKVCLIKKGFTEYHIYDQKRFVDEYHLNPIQLIDVKAFMGDTADGYPGVKGIGEKTAIKLVRQYHSVEGVLEHLNELTASQQLKIKNNIESLKVSQSLAKIHSHVPLEFEDIYNKMAYRIDKHSILQTCHDYELHVSRKFIEKLL